MKAFAIVNLKGGVGKTVTAVNLAAILATEYQRRVLLVDCDPQANATQSLLPPGEYNTLAGLLTLPDAYYDDLLYRSSIRGLDVLPADDELRNLDVDLLEGERPRLTALRDLRDAIAEDDAYDVLILDCPPALSPACAAAIAASTDVIIPIKVDAYSVRGMHELTAQIDRLRRIYPDVHIAGCLPTVWYKSDTVEQGGGPPAPARALQGVPDPHPALAESGRVHLDRGAGGELVPPERSGPGLPGLCGGTAGEGGGPWGGSLT